MKPVRTAARAMLASILVISGAKILLSSDRAVAQARPLTDKIGPLLEKVDPRIPTDARSLVRIKAASDVVAGVALATGRFTRPAAAVLAAGLLPTTVAGHAFWEKSGADRSVQQTQFLNNLGLLGGLLRAAADTEGRPGLRYRAGQTRRAAKRAARSARREADHAVHTARREADLASRKLHLR